MFNYIENEYRKSGNITSKEFLILLNQELERQVNILVKLGFHKKLGMTKKAYRESLSFPGLLSQPESFKKRFDILVIVDSRIDWRKQYKLAGIINHIPNSVDTRDWGGDPKGYKTLGKPYIAWMQDGTENLGKSVTGVRQNLFEDERGGTLYDGLSLAIFHPEIFKDHYIDLPGTCIGSDKAPCLVWSGSHLRLFGSGVGDHGAKGASVTCGRKLEFVN